MLAKKLFFLSASGFIALLLVYTTALLVDVTKDKQSKSTKPEATIMVSYEWGE